jgi:hypothetical protein
LTNLISPKKKDERNKITEESKKSYQAQCLLFSIRYLWTNVTDDSLSTTTTTPDPNAPDPGTYIPPTKDKNAAVVYTILKGGKSS